MTPNSSDLFSLNHLSRSFKNARGYKELQCDFNKNAVVFGGTPLKLERENIMSYYQCEFERKTFSLEQTNHIRQALIERRNRGLQVTEIIQ